MTEFDRLMKDLPDNIFVKILFILVVTEIGLIGSYLTGGFS